jgi:hypothetical protein
VSENRTGHVKFGSWDFDWDVHGFQGLSLLNGTYKGHTAIGMFSMPAIRVKYLVDGGWLDWRRLPPFRSGAGPYADRLFWKLGGDHGLQRISNRGGQYVGHRRFVLNGTQWMELGIYGRIGAYHIYQAWYLSEDGWVAPRIWSKGLTITMDHWHHPYWRLDFDIDGAEPNSVFVRKFGNWSQYQSEVNDVKDGNPAADTAWFVRNDNTGQGAFVFPGPDDGTADGFSGLDVGIRRYIHPEQETPWRYERNWRGNWEWQFDTGELGFLNGEGVSNTDIVFWYVSHMHHHAHEGEDHWGSSGPAIQFRFDLPRPRIGAPAPAAPRRQRPGDLVTGPWRVPIATRRQRELGIRVEIEPNQFGNDTTVHGHGFTPGGSVVVTFDKVPNRVQLVRYATADAQGSFKKDETFRFTSQNRDDASGSVDIYAFDANTGRMAKWTGSASPWVA